jgi:hypothetical protein
MKTLKTGLTAGFLAVALTGCDNLLTDVVYLCSDQNSFTRWVVRDQDHTLTLSFRAGRTEMVVDKMVGEKFRAELIERAKAECAGPSIR